MPVAEGKILPDPDEVSVTKFVSPDGPISYRAMWTSQDGISYVATAGTRHMAVENLMAKLAYVGYADLDSNERR